MPQMLPHRAQVTSVRCIQRVRSSCSSTAPGSIGSEELGQPVPDSYFVVELKSAAHSISCAL